MSYRSSIHTLGFLALTALFPLSSCSLEGILPELDGNAGSATEHVQAVLHPPRTRSIPPQLQGIEIEVKDVLLRRSSDQSWNILNDKPAMWVLGDHATQLPTFSAVPMPRDAYDAIRVVLGSAFVIQNGQRIPMNLATKELTSEGSWQLFADKGIDLWLSVDNAVSEQGGTWLASPSLEIATRDADFSNESLGQSPDPASADSTTEPQS